MDFKPRIVSIAAVICMTAGPVGAAQAEPFRISYFIWPGNGPFFVAQEKGLFAKEASRSSWSTSRTTLRSSQLLRRVRSKPFRAHFKMRRSSPSQTRSPGPACSRLTTRAAPTGCSRPPTSGTIAELKGRTVAAHRDGLPGLDLNLLLRDADVDRDNVELVDLGAEDAAQAFLLREVDAAVTYEPFLSEAMQAGHGHLLTNSSEQPGLMFDCLMTKRSLLEARKEEFEAVARAWDAAVRYVEAHPDEANEIMARHVGGGLDDPAAFAETLKGVSFYDAEANRAFFGTPGQPGPIYETMQLAIDVLSDAGQLKTELTPADVIAHGILGE